MLEYSAALQGIPVGSKVFIYGAGRYGMEVLRVLTLRGDVQILGFVDTYKDGRFAGYRVWNILEFADERPKCDLVVVASAAFYEQMCEEMSRLGYKFVVPAKSILKIPDEVKERIDEISKRIVRGAELYRYVVYSIIEGRPEDVALLDVKREEQYLEYILTHRIRCAVDGGVYEGGFSKVLSENAPNLEKIYGFEPWGDAFLRWEGVDKLLLVKKALWSRSGRIFFYVGYDRSLSGSAFVSEKRVLEDMVEVPAISLEDFVKEEKIDGLDMIKLDVEGAELEVIKGAEKAISVFRPQLAVSVYHKFTHYYEVPEAVFSILEDCVLFFGHYSKEWSDSVMYFIPKEIWNVA